METQSIAGFNNGSLQHFEKPTNVFCGNSILNAVLSIRYFTLTPE